VSPVVEKGATSRRLYLPRGEWYDFWTESKVTGGREIDRQVDLATMPLHVRAGAILPFGPIKQYVDESVDGPLTLVVYPGANGAFTVYEDDGRSFNYRRGEWTGIDARWDDSARRLSLRLAAGSRMLAPLRREIEVRLAGDRSSHRAVFTGQPLAVTL
jgi:alpha-glucosidase (family GH31 glycosyl hydrolase)